MCEVWVLADEGWYQTFTLAAFQSSTRLVVKIFYKAEAAGSERFLDLPSTTTALVLHGHLKREPARSGNRQLAVQIGKPGRYPHHYYAQVAVSKVCQVRSATPLAAVRQASDYCRQGHKTLVVHASVLRTTVGLCGERCGPPRPAICCG